MTPMHLAMRLLIDGVVVVPDVVTGDELKRMSDAFEKRTVELGKRHMTWEEMEHIPDLVRYIGHPNLLAVVELFIRHFGEDTVFCNCSGMRDVFNPDPASLAKVKATDFSDLRTAPVGWHDDVMGMRNPFAPGLQTGLNSLIYLDDTYADNGAYVAAMGSHHLSTIVDNKPIHPQRDMVLDHCELKPLPVKAGSVIVSRTHHWHGVIAPQQRRRVMLQTFGGKSFYAQQEGHTQLSEQAISFIPAERRRFLTSYAEMGAAR